MAEPFIDQVLRKANQAQSLYHRLLLLVAPAGSGKTALLQELTKSLDAPLINLNLELSRRMLELSGRQRTLRIPVLLQEITRARQGGTLLLDNMEVLFDPTLKQDPMRLLQGLSRNQTVIASWNGHVDGNGIDYAAPGHPEHRRYPVKDFLVAAPEMTT